MNKWLSLLACPVLRGPLHLEAGQLTGDVSASPTYPIIDDIPWLFPDPKHTLHEWRERTGLLLNHFEGEIAELKVSANEATSKLAKARIENLRLLKIRQFEFLKKTLEPLKPGKVGQKGALEKSQAFGYRLPLRQGLLGYFPNLVRDWSNHFESENQISFDIVQPLLPANATNILVLGAGGSRLAYDIAKARPDSTVIAFDLNPVLIFAAATLNRGKALQAAEFSVSPKDPMTPGRATTLAAKQGPATNLHFAFGDAYHLPFIAEGFDACVTPWLIDILPRHVENLLIGIARILKADGEWINFGSFRFDFTDPVENISQEELAACSLQFGLTRLSHQQLEIPYLQSEFDAHRRFETVSIGRWRKAGVAQPAGVGPTPTAGATTGTTMSTTAGTITGAAATALIDDRAAWIQDTKLPIPALPVFQSSSATHAVMALVLSLVDGRRTLREIAAVIAAEHSMSDDDAIEATASFFDRFLKDRRFRDFS